MTILRMILARITAFFRRRPLDLEFEEELATHLAMAEEEKIRQGFDPKEARRQARIELGGLTQLKEAGREARGLPWLDALWIDTKLGLRMLRKSWGLTLVAGLAMTVAIAMGSVAFAFFDLLFLGRLPLDEGDRIVALQVWDAKAHGLRPHSLENFEQWRQSARSVEDLGAYREIERFLVLDQRPPAPVRIAEMTPSGFDLARVPPLIGRVLTETDESPGAAPVVVLGFAAWQEYFFGAPTAIGTELRIGQKFHTVIGVMPEGFSFPVNHQFWIPLRSHSSAPRLDQPLNAVFARLSPGTTTEGAGADLARIAALSSTADPGEDLRPRVVPYTYAMASDSSPAEIAWILRLVALCGVLLLLPPCANIAILVYARAVTRREEFAARFVLGASRTRIVAQVFVELLLLTLLAAGGALIAVKQGLRLLAQWNTEAPFWIDFSLRPRTILFALFLAVIAAVITGVMPALKATGRKMQSGLRALGSGTGLTLGKTWTALIVVQVMLAVAALPLVAELGWGLVRQNILGTGIDAEKYLTATVVTDPEAELLNAFNNSTGSSEEASAESPSPFVSQAELLERLRAEPGITGVSIAAHVPGDGQWRTIEIEGSPEEDPGFLASDTLIQRNQVDAAFIDLYEIPLLAGRGFEVADYGAQRPVAVVNRTFAEKLLADSSPLGQRFRYLPESGAEAVDPGSGQGQERWFEIVGVIADRPAHGARGSVYHPVAPDRLSDATIALRMESAPTGFAGRLQDIATAVDPGLHIDDVVPLDEIYREKAVGNYVGASTIAAITLCLLLLSSAGIYALMSFTIYQRRREIGIRSALGASPRQVLGGVFRRAFRQLATGAALGVGLASLIAYVIPIQRVGGWEIPGVIPAAMVLMITIGLLAAAGPARRGLRVEPTEALKDG